MEFRIDDWVQSIKYPHLKPIKIQSAYESNTRPGTQGLRSRGTVLYSDEVKLWTPKQGEWCWFYNNDKQPFLAQLEYYDNDEDSTEYITVQGLHGSLTDLSDATYSFQYCEPFIGELPTIYK